jgi:hypothetical protein
MVAANPLWRAPRIHGELKVPGMAISERSVSRILPRLHRPPSQTWKTFLRNPLCQTVSLDFFTVPTITLQARFVFLGLVHGRREVLHFKFNEHPPAAWTAQQIVEALADRDPTRYLIRDLDSIYGHDVPLPVTALGRKEVLTAPESPWQNPYVERLIGSIRRECLNHFVILNTRHLKRTLALYLRYCHESRPHLGLGKQCPFRGQVLLIAIPQLGGLQHRYERCCCLRPSSRMCFWRTTGFLS